MKGKFIQCRRYAVASKRRQSALVIGICLIVALSVTGLGGPWRISHWSEKIFSRPLSSTPAVALPSPSNPSKEYIYLAGRLIATEEPNPATLLAPTNLVAATASGSRIDITWSATAGADHYQVERSPNISTAYAVLSSTVLTTNFSDASVTGVTAYLYRVRAIDSAGNISPYSNVDVATAITFTDDPLAVRSTVIKAQHIWELRQAVNAVRATANLAAVNWTNNVTSANALVGITVLAIHIEELRNKLDEALTALGLSVSQYTDPAPPGLSGMTIKKIHIDQLRQRVK